MSGELNLPWGWQKYKNPKTGRISYCPICFSPLDIPSHYNSDNELTSWEGQCIACASNIVIFND